jgi:GT2 family glycosyltransferase/glycosyltransferase involved in cell wall biosynthesis
VTIIIGHLDGIFGREVRGWAAYLPGNSKLCTISIRRDNIELGSVKCEMPRPDVAKERKISESCGFVFRLPLLPSDPVKFASELQFYESGTNKQINLNIPKGNQMEGAISEQNVNLNFIVKAILKEMSALRNEVNRLKGSHSERGGETSPAPAAKQLPSVSKELHGFDVLQHFLSARSDIILCFGIIPWKFRHQRPQHLINHLKDNYSAGVIYFNPSFVRAALPGVSFREVDRDVMEVSFSTGLSSYDFYSCSGTQGSSTVISRMLTQVIGAIQSKSIVFSKVDHPGWYPFLGKVHRSIIIYDKMDLISDFANSTSVTVDYEKRLEDIADLIVVSSASLMQSTSETNKSVLVRNAATPNIFNGAYKLRRESRLTRQPVIGYLGAVSEWFDFDLLCYAAKKLPDFKFRIVGNCDAEIPEAVTRLKNVEFLPEIPYEDVPDVLSKFSVGIIPFQITNLIKHVDPVKAYEYLAVGLPVVATDMPELLNAPGSVYKCSSKVQFVSSLKEAVRGSFNAASMERRRLTSEMHTWAHRARLLEEHIDALKAPPSVSIVILHYGNITLTENCLFSVFKNTDRAIEVIVVDNSGGALEGSAYIMSLREKGAILYENPGVNLGFAKGMNWGIQRAAGEFVVLANNDIYVTPGWLSKMVQHFAYKRDLGILGPVTNMTGNEQKMKLVYSDIAEMELFSDHISEEFSRRTFRTNNLAFFLTMVRREVFNTVGMLDEGFGVGYFEDDDYCRRVMAAGYGIGIADDVFIHHEHSASFNLLGDDEKNRIFIENKKRFEEKWGAWLPHKYRADPLFG